ncbi:hypothetical protein EJ06DRAFT_170614 [Trichodelitschia bisporula]|uniref:Uncharacterized protein n=1 Tax=Trichodelitschia bisporula TaxID=703511 RepID=A0A6G1HLQ8_9PEZI|nr:hypothetical protein EJ06DRAFT_170614 [Trichodelitschia bisporula]
MTPSLRGMNMSGTSMGFVGRRFFGAMKKAGLSLATEGASLQPERKRMPPPKPCASRTSKPGFRLHAGTRRQAWVLLFCCIMAGIGFPPTSTSLQSSCSARRTSPIPLA